MKYCNRCGNHLNSTAKYCNKCGNHIRYTGKIFLGKCFHLFVVSVIVLSGVGYAFYNGKLNGLLPQENTFKVTSAITAIVDNKQDNVKRIGNFEFVVKKPMSFSKGETPSSWTKKFVYWNDKYVFSSFTGLKSFNIQTYSNVDNQLVPDSSVFGEAHITNWQLAKESMLKVDGNFVNVTKEIHLPTFTYPSVDANNNLWFSNTNYNSSFPGLFIYDGKEMQYKFSYDNILLPPRHSKYLGLTGLRFSPNDKFAVAFVKDKKFVNTIPLMEDRKIAKALDLDTAVVKFEKKGTQIKRAELVVNFWDKRDRNIKNLNVLNIYDVFIDDEEKLYMVTEPSNKHRKDDNLLMYQFYVFDKNLKVLNKYEYIEPMKRYGPHKSIRSTSVSSVLELKSNFLVFTTEGISNSSDSDIKAYQLEEYDNPKIHVFSKDGKKLTEISLNEVLDIKYGCVDLSTRISDDKFLLYVMEPKQISGKKFKRIHKIYEVSLKAI